jgi:integrase
LNALAQVFKTAVHNGMCLQSEIPSISAPTVHNRRPDFKKEELPKLKDKLQEYIDCAPDNRIRDRRIDLRDYVLLQLHIGCRNEELLNLGTKHLEKFKVTGQQCYIATLDGKTKQRKVFVDAYATNLINKRVKRHNDKLHNRLWQVVDFSNIFGNWIKWSGLEYNSNNEKRTMYSLRHTYATQKIISTKGDWGAVALQMGTSIEMLQRHYSHVLIENQAHVLDNKPALDNTFNKLFDVD